MQLPKLYPILDVGSLQAHGLPLVDFARALLDGGAQILQLRDKQGSPQEILQRAEVLSNIAAGYDCLLVMNDRVDLALLAGWRAAHLGHLDLPPDDARRIKGVSDMVLGVSTHNAEQVQAAEQGTADYVAIGPVFSTSTKPDAEAVVGLEGVRAARAHTRKPLVAIGGVTLETAAAVIDAGADSVAVIGALLHDGAGAGRAMRDFLERLR